MKAILEELRKMNEELPLKDYGVFVYRRDGHNCLQRQYFDRKADAISHAKSLELPDGMCVKVWQRTDDFDNRGFDKLVWSSCDEAFEDLKKFGKDLGRVAMGTNPVSALYLKNEKAINNTVKDGVRTLKNLTSKAWEKLKKKKGEQS